MEVKHRHIANMHTVPERIRKSWSNDDWFDYLTSLMSRRWIQFDKSTHPIDYCMDCSTSMFVVYTKLMFVVYMLDVEVEHYEDSSQ